MSNYSQTYMPQSAVYNFVSNVHSLKLIQNSWNFFCGTRIQVSDLSKREICSNKKLIEHPQNLGDVNFVLCGVKNFFSDDVNIKRYVLNQNQVEDTPLLDFIALAKPLTNIKVSNSRINTENHSNFNELVLVDSFEVLPCNPFCNSLYPSSYNKSIVINCSHIHFDDITKRIDNSLGFIDRINITFMTKERDAITLQSSN